MPPDAFGIQRAGFRQGIFIQGNNRVKRRAFLVVGFYASEIQLHQLFGNLVSNAIKFSSENPAIDIKAEKLPPEEAAALKLNRYRKYTKISFKDNGQGFEQQYGDQVFKMFKRLSNTSGTGIGLALCKKIVENHNGHISVASEPGKGTEFTIILPVE